MMYWVRSDLHCTVTAYALGIPSVYAVTVHHYNAVTVQHYNAVSNRTLDNSTYDPPVVLHK